MFTFKKVLASLLTIAILFVPLQVFAEEPASTSIATYAYTDEDVLARGRFYYPYLNQLLGDICNDFKTASELALTGAIGFSDTDYSNKDEFDAKASQGKVSGPTIYVEFSVTDANGKSTTYYAYDLLPVGGYAKGSLAQTNYTTAIKNFAGTTSNIQILGNGFVKDSVNYKVQLNLSDYAALGYPTTKTQFDAIHDAELAAIVETPERYYANLEKLLMTRGSNTEINEVIVCVKGLYTDDELKRIDYTDDSKIQYWMDYYTLNMKNERLRVKKAYSLLGDLTVIGNASGYNKMSLIANGRNPDYYEIAPGMYRNESGWTVFRVDLSDYSAKGYVY